MGFIVRRNKTGKKKWGRNKKKQYRKPDLRMFKVPKQKVDHFKRERWLDLNLTAPGGSAWTVENDVGRTDPDVLAEDPILNFAMNAAENAGDPEYSRVTWQPVFQFAALPGLGDIQSLYTLYKINKISITLYPMRQTNPIQVASNTPINRVATNAIITTMYAKTGLESRITMGTEDFSQVMRKSTKLYNLGIGDKKLGWYFTPNINKLSIKNPGSGIVPVVDPGTADAKVNVADAFAKHLGKAGWQDIATGLNTDHHGPLVSIRSVDGSSLVGGTEGGNNWKFRVCVKYYFSCKGVR